MNRVSELLVGRTRLALVAGGLMWLLWVVTSLLGSGNLDRNGQVIGTDHTAFHTAAQLLVDGRGEALFEYPNLTEFQSRQETITGKPGFIDPYRNPPFYALLYEPTARLPYLASFAIWATISLGCLMLGLWLLVGREWLRVLPWALTFYPVFATVSFGQNPLLSFAIFCGAFAALNRDRPFAAGLAAGLLLYKPQLLLGLGLWWLIDVRRFWPAWLGLGTTGAIFAAVSAVFVPGETHAWLNNLPAIARYDAFEFYNLHTPRGFGALLTDDKSIGNAIGLVGLALGVIAFLFFRTRTSDRPVLFAAAVFVTLWASPHTMTYEWSLALIPAALLWYRQPEQRSEWLPLFAIAWLALFVSTPLTKLQQQTIGYAVQVSVPILGYVACRAARLLSSGEWQRPRVKSREA